MVRRLRQMAMLINAEQFNWSADYAYLSLEAVPKLISCFGTGSLGMTNIISIAIYGAAIYGAICG
jgi:hypothetical protein